VNKYIQIEDFLTDFPLVNFYTVRVEEAKLSEMEKFIERFCKLLDEQIRERNVRINGKILEMGEPGFYF
jgi:hypothetical protein